MIRRRLIFGTVFLAAGILLVLLTVLFEQHWRWVGVATENGWTEWRLDSARSDLEESVACSGMMSSVVGVLCLSVSAIQMIRRRSFSD